MSLNTLFCIQQKPFTSPAVINILNNQQSDTLGKSPVGKFLFDFVISMLLLFSLSEFIYIYRIVYRVRFNAPSKYGVAFFGCLRLGYMKHWEFYAHTIIHTIKQFDNVMLLIKRCEIAKRAQMYNYSVQLFECECFWVGVSWAAENSI